MNHINAAAAAAAWHRALLKLGKENYHKLAPPSLAAKGGAATLKLHLCSEEQDVFNLISLNISVL